MVFVEALSTSCDGSMSIKYSTEMHTMPHWIVRGEYVLNITSNLSSHKLHIC